MTQKREHRGVWYTRAALKDCLLQLMKNAPIEAITVTELCRIAGINRSTFYTYYDDVYHLLNAIQDEFYDELGKVLALSNSFRPTTELLTDIYKLVLRHRDVCEVILGEYGNYGYLMRVARIQRDAIIKTWYENNKTVHRSTLEHVHAFSTAAHIGMLLDWLRNGFRESPEQLAEITSQLLASGINSVVGGHVASEE